MNKLCNEIYHFYIDNFDTLPLDKQFHFASRLWLWSDDGFCARRLQGLRTSVTGDNSTEKALRSVYEQGKLSVHHGSKNASGLRAPYFEKYPDLRTVAMVLFRYTFLKTIYAIDGRKTLLGLFSGHEIEKLLKSIFADKRAVAVLSTHAVNAQYLYTRLVLEDDSAFDPETLLRIGQSQYNFRDPVEIQLYIYLYTHYIINKS